MPFTAEARPIDESQEWRQVSAFGMSRDELIALRDSHALRCPDPLCRATLYVRLPVAARFHFYHKPSEGSGECLLRGGESPLHIEAKSAVVEWVERQDRYHGCQVSLEHIFDNGEARRVADVLVQMPDGETHVIECQVSNQTVEEFQTRTRDYYRLGADYVLWFIDEEKARGE